MVKYGKRVITIFIILYLFILNNNLCFAVWEKSEPIRVGIFPLGNFQNYDEDGNVYGYNIQYLKKIAEFKHWEYEYVKLENWVEATEYLEQGKIDLLAPAQNIPQLSERFAYAAFPMGTEAAAIYVLNDREDIIYQDFERMKTLHFGGAKNSTFTQNFLIRTEEKGFTPNLTYYENTSELFNALQKGEVDAIVTNIMFENPGIKIIDRFSPLPVYYISAKGNSYLLDEIYDAMCAVEMNNPSFQTDLMAEFFPYYSNTDFTYDELEYIKQMPEISIGYWKEGTPLSYQDSKTGEFMGITRDILERISEISGFKFQYIALPATMIDVSYLKERNIYILSGVSYQEENLSIPELWLSTPYLSTEKVLVGKENMNFNLDANLTLTTTTGSSIFAKFLNKTYPNFEIQIEENLDTCFKQIEKGQADILLQNRYVVEPYLAKPIYQDMKIFPVQSLEENLCIATLHLSADSKLQYLLEDNRFLSIIDKSIQRLSKDDINDIIIRHTLENQYHYKISDFIYQYRALLFALSIFLIIVIIGILKVQHMKEQKNKILSHAIEQANRANIAKSQFLSNMSHEIRTPLNAIIGMTTLALKVKGNPQKTIQYLEKVTESSKLLMSIINDILDMSAIESQKLRISEQPFDFKALLTSISELYYTQCKQKGIFFEMHLENIEKETLVGDSLRVNQVLMNLLSNAYKFTEKGGFITVDVLQTMFSKEQEKVFMRFIVKDTGCGMSEEMLQRLFKAFEQESSDTALKHGGSGLGLAITRNLVNMMHGEIKVTSKKGEGSTFTIDLPFGITDSIIASDPARFRDIRVMIVDDDEYMCEYLSSILSNMNVSFNVAKTGEMALTILEEGMLSGKPYHICFLDWRMPNMDGLEVAKQIRERISKDILTIIISAYDLSEITEEANAVGIDKIIAKPLFQSSIYNILMSVGQKSFSNPPLKEEQYDFTGKRALLAEDFELNREMAVDLLALVHLDVDCAEDGKQAVDMFLNAEPGTYDIILMDIQMPEMNGYEAMEIIRKSNHIQARAIPIYAMTANAFAEDVSKALSAGANGHIAKPIDSKALYKLLYKCLMEGKTDENRNIKSEWN